MTTPSIARVFGSAIVAIAAVVCVESARAQGACPAGATEVRKGGWLLDVSYRPSVTPSQSQVGYVITSISHAATASGVAFQATGTAQVQDGTSNTIMWAERVPALLSCDDVNLDGVAGIALLQFSLRDGRTGAIVPVSVIPKDGELDHPGEEAVTIVIGGVAVQGSVTLNGWVFGTELPG